MYNIGDTYSVQGVDNAGNAITCTFKIVDIQNGVIISTLI